MVKNILKIGIVLLLVLSVTSLVACDPKEKEPIGTFYKLQEVYDKGLLTLADLHSIANYHNNGTTCSEELSNSVTEAIKEDAAIDMHNNEPSVETKAEDFDILKYYGTYNDCAAIILNDPYHDNPAVYLDITVEIAGVQFHYNNSSRIIIWKQS